MRLVTHCDIALAAHQQLACLQRVDRAGSACQRHRLEDCGVTAHNADAADLQAETALFLWRPKQPRIFPASALQILFHAALGPAEDADLEGLLVGYQATVVSAATHDCRRGGSGDRRRKRCGPSTVVVSSAFIVVRPNGRVIVAAVGVQVTADLRAGHRCQ